MALESNPHPQRAVRAVERHHRLLETLFARAPRAVTGETLAALLEVSVRTVQRDVAVLIEAGIPLTSRRGLDGGYSAPPLRTATPIAFNHGEMAALIAALVGLGPYTSATSRSALAKLTAPLADGSNL